jgi:hypothetical protein
MRILQLASSKLAIAPALALALALAAAGGPAVTQADNVSLSWVYTNPPPDVFKVYQSTNLAPPLTWQVILTVPGTNSLGQVTTNASFSVVPSNYFWMITASNFWGESLPSNSPGVPPPVGNVSSTAAKRL